MSKSKVNLEKILAEWVSKNLQEQGRSKEASDAVAKTSIEGGGYWYILEAMKEACRQTLKLAAENAKMEVILDDTGELISLESLVFKPHPYNKRLDEDIHINKQSILNTIKQIE